MAWPVVPAVGGSVKVRLEAWEEDACRMVVKLVDAFLNRSWPVVLAEPKVKAPLTAKFPGMVMGVLELPMTTAVDEAVPRLRVPALSTVTSASPNMPELLTVNIALAVRATDPRRQRTPINR